jgi:hypothetical protein
MTVQKENEEHADLLAARFQNRAEPNFAAANVTSTFQLLQNLRGFWPFSSLTDTWAAADLSGQGRTLTNTGPCPSVMLGLLPTLTFTGATYLSRADEAGLDITGGLSVCGWFKPTNLAAQVDLITKWTNAGNQAAYALSITATGRPMFAICNTGVPGAAVLIQGTAGDISINNWYFIGGRFIPNTEVTVFINLTKYTNAAAVPAAIFNSSAALLVGGVNGAATLIGNGTLCALAAAAWSDTVFNNLYEQTKVLFGL